MEIPKLHKIFALIPEELFEELTSKNSFSDGFDAWITQAILDRLKKDGEQI